jgi:acetyl-CoA carboxylase carboxyl transferase subunit alpha
MIMSNNNLKSNGAWEKVNIARMLERPTALAYINRIFDGFIEFHGDRCFGDDNSIVSGIAKIDKIPVTVIAQQKGENTKDNLYRNFGMPNPEGYRKALRLMKQAEKFNRPIICFVDTPGAYPGLGAEERGQGEAIAKNLYEMMNLTVPVISIFIGEGGSGGALALAVANEVWMLENSIYSILSPEGFATILWKDSTKAKDAADIMKITAQDLKELGIIEKIIEEPKGGAHTDVDKMAEKIKLSIVDGLNRLSKYTKDELLDMRYNKFRNVGDFFE